MSEPIADKAAFRIRDHYEPPGKPKNYRRSYEVFDERLQRTQARCDLVGNVALKPQQIVADDGEPLRLEPNRKFMPSLWTLSDAEGGTRWQFRNKAWGAVVNPFHKTLVTVLDAGGEARMQLVDLHAARLPVVLGLEWGEYALVHGEQPLATITRLPRENAPLGDQRKGLMGAVRRVLSSSDPALVSVDGSHPLPAPAVLALYLLYRELTDVSGG